MQKTIISDASCLILLDQIGEINLLNIVFGEVIVTSIIAEEFGKLLPGWIKIREPENKNYQYILQTQLDAGEASAIALAVELKNCLLILDDYKARRFAAGLGLHYTGTLGIIAEAKLQGHIPSIRPILARIKNTKFHITPELEEKILRIAGEWNNK